jgi:hypothetical protein
MISRARPPLNNAVRKGHEGARRWNYLHDGFCIRELDSFT